MLHSKNIVENETDDAGMIPTLMKFMVLEHIMNNLWFYVDF